MVLAYATAPALIYVAGLMLRELVLHLDWSDVTEAMPASRSGAKARPPPTHRQRPGAGLRRYALKPGTGRWRGVHGDLGGRGAVRAALRAVARRGRWGFRKTLQGVVHVEVEQSGA